MHGWIKLHRELMEKAIWRESTNEQKVVLITLLMMANHETREWEWQGRKYVAKPGQFVTSLNSIAQQCGNGISVQNVRSSLLRFEKYGFLTNESTKRNRLVTITNWALYQSQDEDPTKDPTDGQQRPNKDPTTNKNERMKECKNEKKLRDIVQPLEDDATVSHTPHQKIVSSYNEICNSLPKVTKLTQTRRAAIRSRWKDWQDESTFETLFQKAEASDFLSGRNGKWTHCNFDWLLKESNAVKVLEGNYDNRPSDPIRKFAKSDYVYEPETENQIRAKKTFSFVDDEEDHKEVAATND